MPKHMALILFLFLIPIVMWENHEQKYLHLIIMALLPVPALASRGKVTSFQLCSSFPSTIILEVEAEISSCTPPY
jgi:hypothetical protein